MRFVKMFKLSDDITPNLNKRRNEGALQFLLHKRYVENSFGKLSCLITEFFRCKFL